ncbi:hypothetical protein FD21_GL001867 [Liquorilactobacillus vini DSM 20605]|uniref:Uncharacterized protein n=1 Tax=Liquorilactobacillus vini DSM 20605 TaxID=1133569 RepID=A0A0R2C9E9_9LACO|nr:hypothetical protein FD21_GL001867 [Liquorilactobacillus vini DSM 20605]
MVADCDHLLAMTGVGVCSSLAIFFGSFLSFWSAMEKEVDQLKSAGAAECCLI